MSDRTFRRALVVAWFALAIAAIPCALTSCVGLEFYDAPCARNGECAPGYYCNTNRKCIECETPLAGRSNVCFSTSDETAACSPLVIEEPLDDEAACGKSAPRCDLAAAGPACRKSGAAVAGDRCDPDALCGVGLVCVGCEGGPDGRCAPASDADARCKSGLTDDGRPYDCRCLVPCDFLHPDNALLDGANCGTACEPLWKSTESHVATAADFDGEKNGPFVNGIWVGACYQGILAK